jgi:large subunit ribosomal protein L24
MKIKRGDTVKVIAGDDKGKTGVVIQALPKENRVIVQGVNIVKKHRKPSQANPEGAIEEKEAPINVSNVALLLNPKSKAKKNIKAVRVGYDFDENGKKIRVHHKSGTKLG